ncbi:MAG: hypothetical protein K2O67_00945 [Clostridia bacterium]|nr:hypothetical protein [Clostridia bacterium]
MKSFKYKFTNLMKVLLIAAIIVSAIGFGLTTWRLIVNGARTADPVYSILTYALMYFVTVAVFVLCLSILLNSSYVIDGKSFKTKFGFIVSKYDVEKITDVTLDRKTNKLTVTFDNEQYIVIVVKQDWYEEFISKLLVANPKIEYSVISLENDGTDKKA